MLKKKMFQFCVELTNGEWTSKGLKKLTKSNLSRLMIQPFAKIYNINTEEALEEVEDFRNLNEFFIRKLHPNARNIDFDNNSFVSPTDGVISEVGVLTEKSTFVVKGQNYNVQTLIGDKELSEKYSEGMYMIIYLSPKNYHRIHFPFDSEVIDAYSLGKYSYPVNDLGLELGDNILSYNYRQIYKMTGKLDYILIPVGAQNVNSIVPTYEDIHVKKGEELGYFEFGSTVVLLFEKDTVELEKDLINREIKMGEKIATVK